MTIAFHRAGFGHIDTKLAADKGGCGRFSGRSVIRARDWVAERKYTHELDLMSPAEVQPLSTFIRDTEIPLDIRFLAAKKAHSLAPRAFLSGNPRIQLEVLDKLDTRDVLSAAGFFLAASLNENVSEKVKELALSAKPRVIKNTEINGDPAVGTIFHLRQEHTNMNKEPDPDDMPKVLNEAETWKYLELIHPDYILAEGWAYDSAPAVKRTDKAFREIMSAFPNGRAEPRTLQQRKCLIKYWGSLCYSFWSPETRYLIGFDEFEKRIIHPGPDPTPLQEREHQRSVFTKRESAAAARIKSVLANHPGANIAIVYGGHHNFSNWFRDINPRLISIDCFDSEKLCLIDIMPLLADLPDKAMMFLTALYEDRLKELGVNRPTGAV